MGTLQATCPGRLDVEKKSPGPALSMPGNEERPLPLAWRPKHRALSDRDSPTAGYSSQEEVERPSGYARRLDPQDVGVGYGKRGATATGVVFRLIAAVPQE